MLTIKVIPNPGPRFKHGEKKHRKLILTHYSCQHPAVQIMSAAIIIPAF
jgi:hypothetical protein